MFRSCEAVTQVTRRSCCRVLRAVGVAATVMVVAAACSSSGSGSSGSAAGPPTGSASGSAAGSADVSAAGSASGSAYVIGTVASVTGPYESSIGGTAGVVSAWQDWTNAHGGVNGHPVKVITMDDSSVPAKGLSEVKQLIDDDHVAAIVGPASNTVQSWYKLAVAADVPVIGGQINGGPLYQTVPLLFPTGTTGYTSVLSVGNMVGKNKFAVLYCAEVPICAASVDETRQDLKDNASVLGSTQIVYTGAVSGSAPNYTASCLAAQAAGANALFVSDGAAVTLRVVNDCASQGYKPLIVGVSASVDNTALSDPLFDDAQVTQSDFPWFAAKNADQQAFQDALKQYDPSVLNTVLYNPNDAQVWASLEVFKAAIERAKPAEVTNKTVLSALYALPKGFSIEGITPPLTYVKNGPNPNVTCYFVDEIKSGKWTAPGPAAATCPS